VGPAVDRHPAELLLARAVSVEIGLGVERPQVGRRIGVIGHGEGVVAGIDPRAAAGEQGRGAVAGARAGLRHGAEAQHVAAQPRCDRHDAREDRRHVARAFVARGIGPDRADAQRHHCLDRAGGRDAPTLGRLAGVADQAIDLVDRDARIGDRLEAGVERHLQGRARRWSRGRSLADAGDAGPVLRQHRAARTAAARRPRAARSRPSPPCRCAPPRAGPARC
jgi:hypothetical protein